MRLNSLVAGAMFAVLAGCATTPSSSSSSPVEPGAVEIDPVPGTVFIYDDGRVERFLRRSDQDLIWATRRGREYTRAANPALPILSWDIGSRSGRRTVFGNADSMWPPRASARARFRVLSDVRDGDQTRRYSQAWSCEVASPRRVSVPAGEFDSFEINCERFSVNTMRLLEKRTWWWAPDLGHFVKRRFQNLRDGEASTIALCGALPELRANESRIEAILAACQ